MLECLFSPSYIPSLNCLFYKGSPIMADFHYNPNVFEASKSIVDKEPLGHMRVEHAKVVV